MSSRNPIYISRLAAIALTLLLVVGNLPARAEQGQAIQPLEDILEAGHAFLLNAAVTQNPGRVEVEMGRLDPRLRLPLCEQPLEVSQPTGARRSGQTTVGVRCPSEPEWSIYVTATIRIFVDALVTTRSLAGGAPLSAGDVTLVPTDISTQNYGYFGSKAEIDGMVTRRPLPAGTVLTQSTVKAPRIVRRGDRVLLVNTQGPIKVEMAGEAISDGAKGDRIRVRALNSQTVVEGWIESASVVKVTL